MDTFSPFALDFALVSDRLSISTSSPLSIALILFQSCLVGTSNLSIDQAILFYLPSAQPAATLFFEKEYPTHHYHDRNVPALLMPLQGTIRTIVS